MDQGRSRALLWTKKGPQHFDRPRKTNNSSVDQRSPAALVWTKEAMQFFYGPKKPCSYLWIKESMFIELEIALKTLLKKTLKISFKFYVFLTGYSLEKIL